jgi:hypothetical protein
MPNSYVNVGTCARALGLQLQISIRASGAFAFFVVAGSTARPASSTKAIAVASETSATIEQFKKERIALRALSLSTRGREFLDQIEPPPAKVARTGYSQSRTRRVTSPAAFAALDKTAGFRVLAFDVNDNAAVRATDAGLGWHESTGELSKSLFASFTVVAKN